MPTSMSFSWMVRFQRTSPPYPAATAEHRLLEDPWNMVHRGRQFEAFSPEGPAEPWQWRAALRTMFPFRRSKMTGWVSGGCSSRRADGQTEPAGGCFDFGASRHSRGSFFVKHQHPATTWLWQCSQSAFAFPLEHHPSKEPGLIFFLTMCVQVPLLVVRSRCSCMTLPSLSKSWNWPFVHSSKRLLRQATRSLCIAELSGCCRRREGMTIIARKATDSSALPSANCCKRRVVSAAKRFPTAPRWIRKMFLFQWTISAWMLCRIFCTSSPSWSPHRKAGEDMAVNRGSSGICGWPFCLTGNSCDVIVWIIAESCDDPCGSWSLSGLDTAERIRTFWSRSTSTSTVASNPGPHH